METASGPPPTSTNPAPAYAYPRIVIESEQHSSSPAIGGAVGQVVRAGDEVEFTTHTPLRGFSLPLEKEVYFQKLRLIHLRTFGGRRTTRPIRKLRRQERVGLNINFYAIVGCEFQTKDVLTLCVLIVYRGAEPTEVFFAQYPPGTKNRLS